METENRFGIFLMEKRKENNLTQKDLAEKLFVSESAVSKWEKDRARPDISLLPKLSEILHITEHELITASVDTKQQQVNRDAKKWKTLSSVWQIVFIISYSVALVTCFICNLAVGHTLNWFWLVFVSVILSASFTTFPKFITKYKLLINSLIMLLSLIIVLGVCTIYTNGDWFWIATIPVLTSYIMVFVPIFIHIYNLPEIVKKINVIISILLDTIMVLILFLVIERFSIVNNYTTNKWALNFALPILLISVLIFLLFFSISKYTPFKKSIKLSICLIIFAVIYPFYQLLINFLLQKALDIDTSLNIIPNLTKWSDNYTNNNIMLFICLSFILTGLILITINMLKTRKK